MGKVHADAERLLAKWSASCQDGRRSYGPGTRTDVLYLLLPSKCSSPRKTLRRSPHMCTITSGSVAQAVAISWRHSTQAGQEALVSVVQPPYRALGVEAGNLRYPPSSWRGWSA